MPPEGLGQSDDDVRQLYHQHAATKGLAAIQLTKAKGQATDDMVARGDVRPQDQQGNDMADATADQAVDLFGTAVLQLGRRVAIRQQQYVTMMVGLHRHLVFMYRARAQLLAEQQAQATAPAP